MPAKALAALATGAALGALLLCAGAADAAAPQFLGNLEGHFLKPEPTAVDQASGDVYVLDLAAHTIQRFDSSGRPAAFSAQEPYVEGDELTGTTQGPLAVNASSFEAQIAVAAPGAAGGTAGDIYVTENKTGVVSIFAPSGEFLGRLTEAGGAPFPEEVCGVTTDPAGDVYVGIFSGEVEKYVPSADPPVNGDFDSRITGLGGICKLAASSTTLYASTYTSGPTQAYPLALFPGGGGSADATGLGTTIEAEGAPVTSADLAVDPADADLYLDEGGQVGVFDSSGNLLESFGSGLVASSQGLAVDGASGDVYVADAGAAPPAVEIFGTPPALAPSVERTSAADVGATSADLQAEINPHTLASGYHFEYITAEAFEANVDAGRDPFSGAAPIPVPDAQVPGTGFHDVAVEVRLQGLSPATAYRYRVLAANSLGTTPGPVGSLTTQALAGGPVLPDGRAYEMVSPLEKNHALITGIDGFPTGTVGGVAQAAADGDGLTYASNGAFAAATSSPLSASYLASRGPGGWSDESLLPGPISSETYFPIGQGGPYKAFSEDLSKALFVNGEHKPIEDPPLTPDAPPGYQNFYVQESTPGHFEAVLRTTPAEPPATFNLRFEGATPDLSTMVFSTGAALTHEALAGTTATPNLYEWSGGRLQLINLLPGEEQGTPGAVLGHDQEGNPGGLDPISTDGSRIFFTDAGHLYVREDGSRTVQVDRGLEGAEGRFQTASSDGSRVFFTRGIDFGDLYELNLGSEQLTDLTTTDPGGADVDAVLGAAQDGSYVYFVADGRLAPGAPSHGSCSASVTGGGPESCNLYVWHRGAPGSGITYIATLSEEDNLEANLYNFEARGSADDWAPEITNRTSRVSPDGLHLVFMSQEPLTGEDNSPVDPDACGHLEQGGTSFLQRPCQEVYDYDAATATLSCVSCDPSGARPLGPASIPGGTDYELNGADYQSRVLSDPGGRARVFFTSSDALLPGDTNGKPDVYEWEQSGRGGCNTAGGCLSLISSGTSASESSFLDASADGDDVFFLTTGRLVPQDTDELFDVYDARAPHVPGESVGAPVLSPPAAPCEGDACQGVVAAPSEPTLATTAASGQGTHVQKPHHKKRRHRHKKKHRSRHRAGHGPRPAGPRHADKGTGGAR